MAHFKLDGTYSKGLPQLAFAGAEVETVEQAREIIAQFPKYLKLHASTLTKIDTDTFETSECGYINVRIQLLPDDVNGGVNETGIKRFLKLLEKLDRLGHTTEWKAGYGNSYDSLDEFLHALDS